MSNYREKKQKLKQLVQREEEDRRKLISEEGHKFIDTDAFKRLQKHYKFYMHRQTDFSKLIKIQDLPVQEIDGLKVYTIPFPQGAYLVKKFSDVPEQYQIGFEALNRYIYRPYRTNLDGTNGLYEKEEEAQTMMEQNLAVQPEEVKDENNSTLYYFNQKIRMANLGYQYDWPKRSYPSTNVPVPQTILKLTQRAINVFQNISKSKIEYRGEAVIVNYYKPRDYMTGHLDDGEIDQVNPIFSFCYGLSCVFLIGSTDRQKEPIAIELQAGDLMIMSGFSRTCYHGVPRIREDSYKVPTQEQLKFDLNIPPNSDGIKWINGKQEIFNYFKSHRLNLNIRQVYPSQKSNLRVFEQQTYRQENVEKQ